MKGLKSIKGFLYWRYRFLRQMTDWHRQVRDARRRVSAQQTGCEASFPAGGKLVLIPHSDDEWIGCSRILAEYDDCLLVNMDMQGGDAEDVHALRRKEMQQVADRFRRTLLDVRQEKSEELAAILRARRPEYVFVPSYFDWHEDHLQVIRFLQTALESLAAAGDRADFQIVMYQVSVPLPARLVTHALPMDRRLWKRKRRIFKETYASQLVIPYRRFFLQDRVNGAYCGQYAAEAYSAVSVSEWMRQFAAVRFDAEEFKTCINDIAGIRALVDRLCPESRSGQV